MEVGYEIMNVTYKDHYDTAYFEGTKTYRAADGSVQTYHGPSLEWDGFNFVADALARVLPKGTLLDIGCSAGDLGAKLLARGFDAYGVDISEYAIDHTVPTMRGRTSVADITTKPALKLQRPDGGEWPEKFDNVIATDLLEHIYEEDIDETFQWMLDKCDGYLFFCVATAFKTSETFVHKKGEPVPLQYEGVAVSGHVNVRPWQYWVKKFREFRLKIRWDLAYVFQIQRDLNPAWQQTAGWAMPNTWILEK